MTTGTDLIAAIKSNEVARAKQVLQANPSVANARDENGVSATSADIASERGHTDLVRLFESGSRSRAAG
ncbi:MAG: hypothetical protein LAN64_12895 [Acidobacteriia bacterium]|nr:hypothetical protein [Terriglobia bacterium]